MLKTHFQDLSQDLILLVLQYISHKDLANLAMTRKIISSSIVASPDLTKAEIYRRQKFDAAINHEIRRRICQAVAGYQLAEDKVFAEIDLSEPSLRRNLLIYFHIVCGNKYHSFSNMQRLAGMSEKVFDADVIKQPEIEQQAKKYNIILMDIIWVRFAELYWEDVFNLEEESNASDEESDESSAPATLHGVMKYLERDQHITEEKAEFLPQEKKITIDEVKEQLEHNQHRILEVIQIILSSKEMHGFSFRFLSCYWMFHIALYMQNLRIHYQNLFDEYLNEILKLLGVSISDDDIKSFERLMYLLNNPESIPPTSTAPLQGRIRDLLKICVGDLKKFLNIPHFLGILQHTFDLEILSAIGYTDFCRLLAEDKINPYKLRCFSIYSWLDKAKFDSLVPAEKKAAAIMLLKLAGLPITRFVTEGCANDSAYRVIRSLADEIFVNYLIIFPHAYFADFDLEYTVLEYLEDCSKNGDLSNNWIQFGEMLQRKSAFESLNIYYDFVVQRLKIPTISPNSVKIYNTTLAGTVADRRFADLPLDSEISLIFYVITFTFSRDRPDENFTTISGADISLMQFLKLIGGNNIDKLLNIAEMVNIPRQWRNEEIFWYLERLYRFYNDTVDKRLAELYKTPELIISLCPLPEMSVLDKIFAKFNFAQLQQLSRLMSANSDHAKMSLLKVLTQSCMHYYHNDKFPVDFIIANAASIFDEYHHVTNKMIVSTNQDSLGNSPLIIWSNPALKRSIAAVQIEQGDANSANQNRNLRSKATPTTKRNG